MDRSTQTAEQPALDDDVEEEVVMGGRMRPALLDTEHPPSDSLEAHVAEGHSQMRRCCNATAARGCVRSGADARQWLFIVSHGWMTSRTDSVTYPWSGFPIWKPLSLVLEASDPAIDRIAPSSPFFSCAQLICDSLSVPVFDYTVEIRLDRSYPQLVNR